VGARGAGALLAHAVLAASRLEMLAVAVVDERIEAGHGLRHHVAAAAAVAAPRAAELDEFLAPERDAAVAAVARLNVDLCLVDKFHGIDTIPTAADDDSSVSSLPSFRGAAPDQSPEQAPRRTRNPCARTVVMDSGSPPAKAGVGRNDESLLLRSGGGSLRGPLPRERGRGTFVAPLTPRGGRRPSP